MIFSDSICDLKVDPGMPSFRAAPEGPDTCAPSGHGLSNRVSVLPGSLSAKRIDMRSMTRKSGFAAT